LQHRWKIEAGRHTVLLLLMQWRVGSQHAGAGRGAAGGI
jgi:hypothetical protein